MTYFYLLKMIKFKGILHQIRVITQVINIKGEENESLFFNQKRHICTLKGCYHSRNLYKSILFVLIIHSPSSFSARFEGKKIQFVEREIENLSVPYLKEKTPKAIIF